MQTGARSQMRPQAAGNRRRIAPEYHRIDEPVRTAIGEVGFCEAQAQPVVPIVGQGHIAMQLSPGEAARRARVSLKANLLLDRQQLVGP